MQRAELLEKTLMLGKIECRRRTGQQRVKWLGGITDSMDMRLNKFWEIVKDREAWHTAVCSHAAKLTWQLNNNNNIPALVPTGSLATGANELEGRSHCSACQHPCPPVEEAFKYGCYCSVAKLCPTLCDPID